jgi:hypothetical protein
MEQRGQTFIGTLLNTVHGKNVRTIDPLLPYLEAKISQGDPAITQSFVTQVSYRLQQA